MGKEPDIALLQARLSEYCLNGEAIARVCLFLNCDAEKVSHALGLSWGPRCLEDL